MNKIKSSFLCLTALLAACVSSCSDDEVNTDLFPTEVAFETHLHLDSSCPCFDGETRAAQGRWENGDAIFITTGDRDNSWRGKATYHADVDDWTLVSNRQLSSSEQGSCSVYYFKGGKIATDGTAVPTSISIDERTAIFSCSDATFRVSDNEVFIESHLTPHTWRMAFCGASGVGVKVKSLSDLKVYSELNLSSGEFNTQKKDIVLTVGHLYTDYFYADFAEIEGSLQIMVGRAFYYREIGNNILKKGQTGILHLPSSNDKKGWNSPECIDLGLASGTKWATYNVGATTPEEYGDYFAWGETAPKETYNWSNYKWCNGTDVSFSKYCTSSDYGTVDNKTILDIEDDAAHVYWGLGWRMPTRTELEELCNYCDWSLTMQNGVEGYKVVGLNGNYIFLPFGGYIDYEKFENFSMYGAYWSSTIRTKNNSTAYCLNFNSQDQTVYNYSRFSGRLVRPVYSEQEITHEYVDLGLPSGLKWATCNVGANSPEEYGDYFAWGETEPKTIYDWSTYKWCSGTDRTMTKYCTQSYYGNVDNKTILDLEDDAAHVNWGGAWRMPTKAELIELRNKCSWSWIAQNGVPGYKVTGPNGNSIFLPATFELDNVNISERANGWYWSSSLHDIYSDAAYFLNFYSGYLDWHYLSRSYGLSIRPVCM